MPFKLNRKAHPVDERATQRQKALNAVDEAKFGWFHVKTCLVSGVGFFADADDLFAINLASAMLGYVYYSHNRNTLPPNIDMGIKIAASIGTLVGQLLFGYLADVSGRKKMYGIVLMIMTISTVGQAIAGQGPVLSIVGVIMFWRVLVGLGIGGDYPLSAVITAEFSTRKRRGGMMAAVFAMQGFGALTTSLVSIAFLAMLRPLILSDLKYLDYVWRIIIGFGVIPSMFALYYRLTIPETPRFTMEVKQDIGKGVSDVDEIVANSKNASGENLMANNENNSSEKKGASWAEFRSHFSKWNNLKVLIGTSVTWFALDVAFYGIGLNNFVIFETIGLGGVISRNGTEAAYQEVWYSSIGQCVIILLGALPGYWVTVFTVDKIGRKTIQLIGFIASTILFLILGFFYHQILNVLRAPVLFTAIFTLTQFFQNFGPNITTFIIPGEVFPTRYRSTCHGISAASGKLGAIVAQVGFSQLLDIGGKNAFIPWLLVIFAGFMFLGFLFTFLIPETKGVSLEELSSGAPQAVVTDDQPEVIQNENDTSPHQWRRRHSLTGLHSDNKV